MTIETLTALERETLRNWCLHDSRYVLGHKVVSLIDALAAERAALVERAERAEADAEQLKTKAYDLRTAHSDVCKRAETAKEQVAFWREAAASEHKFGMQMQSERNALAATLERVRALATNYGIGAAVALGRIAALAGAPAPEGDEK